MTISNRASTNSRRVAFSTALVLVLVIAVGGLLYLVQRKNASSPTKSCSANAVVTFLGDSYTNGTDMDSGAAKRFPALIGNSLRVEHKVMGYNGSGYTVRGPKPFNVTFPEAAANVAADSSIVVVFGSRNDKLPYQSVYDGAVKTYQKLRSTVPNAKVIVIGPPWINNKPNPQILSDRKAVQAAAKTAGLQFVDPIARGWFAQPSEISDGKNFRIGSDHVHPTDAGHAYLADKIKPYVKQNLCRE